MSWLENVRYMTMTAGAACISLALVGSVPSNANAAKPTIAQVTAKLDGLYRSKTTQAKVTMTVVTPDYKRTVSMSVISESSTNTLVRILSPLSQRGIGSLKRGNQMWSYLPKIRKTIRIPSSMMMGSWMGSDFTNDDILKMSTWAKDYTTTWDDAAASPGTLCLRYTPKKGSAVTWQKVVICVNAANLLPKKMTYYDEKGRKARIMTYTGVKKMGGRLIPTRLKLIPLNKKGHSTTIQYTSVNFDAALPSNAFSLMRLRQSF